MKKLAIAISLATMPLVSSADLLITAIYDGPLTGGVPKGVELYALDNIADLSSYGLGGANNGGGTDGEEFTFPAVSVAKGAYIYVSSEEDGFTDFFGFFPHYTSNAMSINGDDAVELFKDGQVWDLFGDQNTDGTGAEWEYLDGWAYRNNTSLPSAEFELSQWQFSGNNALDGESYNDTASSSIPMGSFSPDSGSSSSGNTDWSNLIINEFDVDTEGTDTQEFIELYDGGRGNTDLTGLTLVLYNGSDDASYNAIDLDGYSTDNHGYFIVGNPDVINIDIVIGTSNSIQNGADAIALVEGNADDFPNDTPVAELSMTLDAIVYGTNDEEDTALLILINSGEAQIDENAGSGSTIDSNQRCENGMGGAHNTSAFIQAPPTPGEENRCIESRVTTLISSIQGTPETQGSNSYGETDVSPLIGQTVTVEAIVVGDFQNNDADESRNLGGFFLQEQTIDQDESPTSSEGIFVFDTEFGVDVELGDMVRVSGTVGQYYGETQLSNITGVDIIGMNMLSEVSPASVSLTTNTATTLNQNGKYQPDLEAYEGMLVRLSDTVKITEQYQLDRFNEVRVAAGERPTQFTQLHSPDAALYDSWLQEQGARTLIYDDGLNQQNVSINDLDGFAPYSELTAKRMGDTAANLSGILDYKWAGSSTSGASWRLRSHTNGINVFTSTYLDNSDNTRPISAPNVEGNLTITSFNVLNLFKTIDEDSVITAAGHDPRGADSTDEFDRQLQKTVNAIIQLNADVLGLVEVENEFDNVNDGSTAIEALVNAINSQVGKTTYDYVYPGKTFVGGDAIAVGFIYKPSVVALATNSEAAILDDTVAATLPIFNGRDFESNPLFNGPGTNRSSLAVSFTHLESNDTFTIVANHFKSKGSSDLEDTASDNYDQGNGAGFWNQRRLEAAQAVTAWVDTYPTGISDDDIIILGDLNAYAQEEPVQYLLSQGFNNVENENTYSYVFDGQTGTLDYILLSDSLFDKFNEASVWHINADEADALDYNLDYGRDASYFLAETSTRNSDHDPVLVGLSLELKVSTAMELFQWFKAKVKNGDIEGGARYRWHKWNQIRMMENILYAATINRGTHGKSKRDHRFKSHAARRSCSLLSMANKFSDGKLRPRDLVQGTSVDVFNRKIAFVMAEQRCAQPNTH